MKYSSSYFAQAYGEGAYGEGTYSCTEEQVANGTCTTVATGSAGGVGSGGNGLADTGIAVLAFITAACLIMFVALIVRAWRKPKLVPEEAEKEQQERL